MSDSDWKDLLKKKDSEEKKKREPEEERRQRLRLSAYFKCFPSWRKMKPRDCAWRH